MNSTTFTAKHGTKLFAYTPTANDMLWLGCAAYGETHGMKDTEEWGAMMWTWLNRFMLFKNRGTWPTLADSIRNHSQPVNPIWRRTGYKCSTGGPMANTDHCTANQLQWRDKMAGYLYTQKLPSSVKGFANDFVSGKIHPPPGGPWLDFAYNKVARKYGTRLYGGNYYLNLKQLGNTNLLKAFYPSRVYGYVGGFILSTSLVIGTVIGFGFYLWRKYK